MMKVPFLPGVKGRMVPKGTSFRQGFEPESIPPCEMAEKGNMRLPYKKHAGMTTGFGVMLKISRMRNEE
jgi:hypothetical protein